MPVIVSSGNAARVVVVSRVKTVTVVEPSPDVIEVDNQDGTNTVERDTRLLNVAGIGLRGPQGEPGANAGEVVTASYTSDHPGTLTRGMAVCLIGGLLRRATSVAPYHRIVGLLYEDTLTQGAVGRVMTDGNFTTTTLMWDGATDMVGGLSPSQTYFLTDTGAITPFPPTTTGQYLVPIGTALDSTTLRIELNSSILL